MGKMAGSTPPKRPGRPFQLDTTQCPCLTANISWAVEGAKIPIRLGFKDIDGVTGKYWGNRSISGKGEGQVLRW